MGCRIWSGKYAEGWLMKADSLERRVAVMESRIRHCLLLLLFTKMVIARFLVPLLRIAKTNPVGKVVLKV